MGATDTSLPPLDSSVSDEELMGELAAGRQDALGPLRGRYASLVFNLAAKTLDRATAEEIVQDVFVVERRNQHDRVDPRPRLGPDLRRDPRIVPDRDRRGRHRDGVVKREGGENGRGGVHFVGRVNVAGQGTHQGLGIQGTEQLDWLKADLAALTASTPVVAFAHVPLRAVYPRWG